MKELLDNGIISRYHWSDTRDMVVDGLTKGKLDRTELQKLMNGWWTLQHAVETIHSNRDASS